MGAMDLDLTSYEQVQNAAGNIYGQVAVKNMPPGNPWTADMVQTFLNWMTDECPKGTPAPDQVTAMMALAAKKTAGRIRKDVNSMSAAELATLKKAFEGILAKDASDPNSYFAQAAIHYLPTPFCPHRIPPYNPWHRAYLLAFENALRSIPGCENVTLPVPGHHDAVSGPSSNPLRMTAYTLPRDIGSGYNKGYVTKRNPYPEIADNLLLYDVTDSASIGPCPRRTGRTFMVPGPAPLTTRSSRLTTAATARSDRRCPIRRLLPTTRCSGSFTATGTGCGGSGRSRCTPPT